MALHITRRLLKITLLRLGQRASFPRMQEGQGAQCDLSMKLSLWLQNLHWFKVVGLFGIWILESGLWTLDWNLYYFNKHKICDQSKTCPVRVAVRNVWQTSRIETCLLTWSQLPVAVGNIIPPLKINVQMWTTDTMSNLQRINADSELEP